jgi:uncharacterized membrane protein YbaN (DUF454 family)
MLLIIVSASGRLCASPARAWFSGIHGSPCAISRINCGPPWHAKTAISEGLDEILHQIQEYNSHHDRFCNFREHKAIPLKTKVLAVSLLWLTILFSIIFIVQSIYLRIFLAAIAIAISVHILHFKTLKPNG